MSKGLRSAAPQLETPQRPIESVRVEEKEMETQSGLHRRHRHDEHCPRHSLHIPLAGVLLEFGGRPDGAEHRQPTAALGIPSEERQIVGQRSRSTELQNSAHIFSVEQNRPDQRIVRSRPWNLKIFGKSELRERLSQLRANISAPNRPESRSFRQGSKGNVSWQSAERERERDSLGPNIS